MTHQQIDTHFIGIRKGVIEFFIEPMANRAEACGILLGKLEETIYLFVADRTNMIIEVLIEFRLEESSDFPVIPPRQLSVFIWEGLIEALPIYRFGICQHEEILEVYVHKFSCK
jgi:hypothetical protein